MKKIKYVMLLMLCFLLVGCSSYKMFDDAPSWLSDTYDKQYSKKDYLCAVGTGSSKETAEQNAKSSLSQIFNTKVSVVMQESTFDDTITSSSLFSSYGVINSEVENLLGIETVNIYKDKFDKYWVRIAMNRKNAANNISSMIEADMANIDLLMREYKMDSNHIEGLRHLLDAQNLAVKVEPYLQRLSVIKEYTVKSPLIDIEKSLAAAKKNLAITINYDGSVDSLLKVSLQSSLEEKGFTVKNSSKIILNVKSDFEISEYDGLSYCNMNFQVELKTDNMIIWTYSDVEKGVGINIISSKEKAVKKLVNSFNDNFLKSE